MALKQCSKCGEAKADEEFGWRAKGKRKAHCRACGAAEKRAWRDAKRRREGKAYLENQRIYDAAWRRRKGMRAVPQRSGRPIPVDHEESTTLPIGPFREWLEQRIKHYGTEVATCVALGTASRTLYRWRYEAKFIQLDTADRILTRDGSTFLIELYPLEQAA